MSAVVFDAERWAQVGPLKRGAHTASAHDMCVMEAVAYVAGEPHSDVPACACPVLSAFLRVWNDDLPTDADRDRLLRPFVVRVVGTAGDGHQQARRWLAVDWLVREFAPAWLAMVPATRAHASALRGLAPVVSSSSAALAAPLLVAAGHAAGDAAWVAAGHAARVAAWDAARVAAGHAAGVSARVAAWNAARDAAGVSARVAAWNAARVAAGHAAGDAAGDALQQTVTALQAAAVGLLERMVALGENTRGGVA